MVDMTALMPLGLDSRFRGNDNVEEIIIDLLALWSKRVPRSRDLMV